MATQAVKVNNDGGQSSELTRRVSGTVQGARDFLHDVRLETKQVTWPTRDDVVSTTWVVIGTVAFFGVFLEVVDWIVRYGVGRLFKFFGV